MFNTITLHGGRASLVWGYTTAADLRAWRVVKTTRGWKLTATIASINRYAADRTPLYFTAPRDKGRWCWPVLGELVITGTALRADLGPPEQ